MPLLLRLLLFYVNKLKKDFDYATITATEMRKSNRAEYQKLGNFVDPADLPVAEVDDLTYTARDGQPLTIRYYRPATVTHPGAMLFYHGGGFATRDLDSHDKVCRRFALRNRMPVFSVAYRLAPEHKFPVPLNDCEDAFDWLVQNSTQFDIDPTRIVVAGDSAGANLATVVAIRSRNQAKDLQPYQQVLIYPVTDGRMLHPSITEKGSGYFLTKELMQWFIDKYKRNEADRTNPEFSPLLTKDLSGLPPVYLCVAEHDPLRDEGVEYAEKLRAAGVSVQFDYLKNTVHGCLNLRRPCKPQNEQMNQSISRFLAQAVAEFR
ncbi:MAG: alpha/beta hydrolase [Bacteroidota bacterium]